MGIMAGTALALGIRCMGIFELLGQVGMAVEAEPGPTCIEQLVRVGRMGIMTGHAVSLADRLVHYPLAESPACLLVTGIAHFLDGLLEQSTIPCHMRAVTGEAFPGGSRFMLYFFLKRVTIMTGKTIDLRAGGFPFMAIITVTGRKRIVFFRIEQVLFRAAMGIVTGNT